MGKKKYLSSSTILYFYRIFLILQLLILTSSSDDRQENLALRSGGEDHLQLPKGSPFKIALFADLHFGEDAWTDWGPKQDVNSIGVMSTVLDKEKPGNVKTCIILILNQLFFFP